MGLLLMKNELELPAVTKITPLNMVVEIDEAYLVYALLIQSSQDYLIVIGRN